MPENRKLRFCYLREMLECRLGSRSGKLLFYASAKTPTPWRRWLFGPSLEMLHFSRNDVKKHVLLKTPFFLLKIFGKSQWIDNHVKTNWFPFGSCSGVPFWGDWSAYLRGSVLQLSYPVETLKRYHSFLNPKTVTGRPAECQAMRFMASKSINRAGWLVGWKD